MMNIIPFPFLSSVNNSILVTVSDQYIAKRFFIFILLLLSLKNIFLEVFLYGQAFLILTKIPILDWTKDIRNTIGRRKKYTHANGQEKCRLHNCKKSTSKPKYNEGFTMLRLLIDIRITNEYVWRPCQISLLYQVKDVMLVKPFLPVISFPNSAEIIKL